MIERRNNNATTMWRTRLLLGLLSCGHGIGSAWFGYGAGVSHLVHKDPWGWMFALALAGCGALMCVAAIGERLGHGGRWCREFSASTLGATWIAVFYHSFEGGADTVTLKAPIYIAFCAWCWYSEASVARQRVIRARREATCSAN